MARINFEGIGHPAWALVALRRRKIRDGSGWGRAGIKTVKAGYIRAVSLQGAAETAKECKARLVAIVTAGGNNDWGKNWEIKPCHAAEYYSCLERVNP